MSVYRYQLHTHTHTRTHAHLHVAIFVSKKYAAVRLLEKIVADGSDVQPTYWLADRQTDRQIKRKTGLEESDTNIQNYFFILTKDGCSKLIPVTKRPTQMEGVGLRHFKYDDLCGRPDKTAQ